MNTGAAVALALAGSYLAGSVPFAWIVTKAVTGKDLRAVGSGNVGATNASRALGGKWFLAVFLLDAAKGAAGVRVAAPMVDGLGGTDALRLAIGCGLAAILGHVTCPWLGFRGGKGVATGAGVIAALAPLAAACGLGAFFAALALTRFVSLASCVGAAALAPAAWLLGCPADLVWFGAVVAALVIFLHRRNFARIAAGTEPKAFSKREAGHAG
ncbi:MAG: Glycerol-3-phosphate acyltransferase [Planctomycetes bacterium]|nr:Glycerol-3-phosphate acyltransferase [Planctomycetota bacterium]